LHLLWLTGSGRLCFSQFSLRKFTIPNLPVRIKCVADEDDTNDEQALVFIFVYDKCSTSRTAIRLSIPFHLIKFEFPSKKPNDPPAVIPCSITHTWIQTSRWLRYEQTIEGADHTYWGRAHISVNPPRIMHLLKIFSKAKKILPKTPSE
jgi:hypothetical protein